jgi:hypothetical protein
MNKKFEEFMLSNNYRNDKARVEKSQSGLILGISNNKVLVQKKYMKDELKIIRLRSTKILDELNLHDYSKLKSLLFNDYFYMKWVLVKLNKNNHKFRWNILGVSKKYNREFVDVNLIGELYYYFDYMEWLYIFFRSQYDFFIKIKKQLASKLENIYNDEETDFFMLERQLNKLIEVDYVFIKHMRRHVINLIQCLQMESAFFKFWVNKEAKHELFEGAALSSQILTHGSKKATNGEKITESVFDQIALVSKQFEDKKALLAARIKDFDNSNLHNFSFVGYFKNRVNEISFIIKKIEYDIQILTAIDYTNLNIEEVNLKIKCLKKEVRILTHLIQSFNMYEQYLINN